MKATYSRSSSFRSRLLLYLAGLAAVAVPWGYLLFIRPRRCELRANAAGATRPATNASGRP